jgi:hypothetical protein
MMKTITLWLKNPQRDYAEGVELFGRHGGNKTMLRYFQNTKPRFALDRLIRELEKIERKMPVAAPAAVPAPATVAVEPDVVARVKKMVHEAWVEMSRLQNELFETGTANDDATIARRRELMEKRDPIVDRYNELYEAKEAFFAGKMTVEELQEVVDGKAKEPEKAPKKEVSPCGEMTDVQLTKRSHAVQTNITRVQNQLDYQQDKKGKAKNPMPDCPKRKKLEQKLATLREEQAAIEAEIKKRGL